MRRVEAKWKLLVRARAIQESASTLVNDLRQVEGGWVLETEPPSAAIAGETCKLVVLAVGFGIETRLGERAVLRYWDRDNLHRFPREAQGTIRYLIAGSGDGALIDTVRAKMMDFQHDRVLKDFKLMRRAMRETRERIATIEDDARRRPDAAEFLRIEYERLRGTEEVDAVLRERAHDRVQVVLATRAPHFYSLQSTALNRFLVSRLVALGLVEHRQGELVEVAGGTPARVRLAGPIADLEFYDVVTRIGPASALARHLPSIEDLCAGVPKAEPDPTREPLDWSSLRSPPLSAPVVSAPAPAPRESSTLAYYATSLLAAARMIRSGDERIEIDIDAEDRKSFRIHEGEVMAYCFFLQIEKARQSAIETFGADGASIVQVLIQDTPPQGDSGFMRANRSEGRWPLRTPDGESILVRDLRYVSDPRPAPLVQGEQK